MFDTPGRRILAASATAVSALALLTAPVPALAAPAIACLSYGFAGDVIFRDVAPAGNTWDLQFSAEGQTVDTNGIRPGYGPNGTPQTRRVTGSITAHHIDVTATAGPSVHHYVGDVGSDGKGHGKMDATIDGAQQFTGTPWNTVFPLPCTELAPQAPKPEEPKPAPPAQSADHMFTLTGDVDMYKRPGGNDEDKLTGFLDGGPGSPQVNLIGCQKDNWCQVAVPPDNDFVWVWGDFVPPEAHF